MTKLDHVNYDALDRAKNAFIEASKRTLTFASDYGFLPNTTLGASANQFCLNLKPYLKSGAENLFVTLVPEGLGTADDARPSDLNSKELTAFWYNIGIKTVAVMTNDVASSGMQPILISLYMPSARPDIVFNKEFLDGFLSGFVAGCKTCNCVYFSGETPQLKNKLFEDKLDLAGAVFGVMPSGLSPVDSSRVNAGDFIVFVESSGPHENGFTSLRKLAEGLKDGYRTKLGDGREYWEGLNAPSVLYTPLIQDILKGGVSPSNIEPITGHGWQKLMRSSKPLRYVIDAMLPVPEIFKFVETHSKTSPQEMIKIFNYGAGIAIYVSEKEKAKKIVELAGKHKLKAIVAGHIEEAKTREVVVKPLSTTLSSEEFLLKK